MFVLGEIVSRCVGRGEAQEQKTSIVSTDYVFGSVRVASGAKLSDAQYQAFKAGDLYVNVHSKAHRDGEIRAQLKP